MFLFLTLLFCNYVLFKMSLLTVALLFCNYVMYNMSLFIPTLLFCYYVMYKMSLFTPITLSIVISVCTQYPLFCLLLYAQFPPPLPPPTLPQVLVSFDVGIVFCLSPMEQQ